MDNCSSYQLAVSIVVYAGEYKLLRETIESLRVSLEYASKHVLLLQLKPVFTQTLYPVALMTTSDHLAVII